MNILLYLQSAFGSQQAGKVHGKVHGMVREQAHGSLHDVAHGGVHGRLHGRVRLGQGQHWLMRQAFAQHTFSAPSVTQVDRAQTGEFGPDMGS